MREKVIYIAFDGKEFDNEMECREHEEKRKDLVKVSRAIDTIKNYCKDRGCHTCPFFSSRYGCKFTVDTPDEWVDTPDGWEV